ncbi:hypothetical protein CEXT_195441 [Caerostris extrusa]|uniref:Uncharacterized protein n=1 Tax=Caerostris extrusa TaxID=172846 RepID=A0AAV4UYP1_CAEEX|nr:hypothetical protein CEXT_195441 [Caerostris extrusa]
MEIINKVRIIGVLQILKQKDSNKWNDGNNQGPSGNFGPSDSQRKDSDSWNSRGSYPGNFGPNDAQAKDSNTWNNDRNQQPSRPLYQQMLKKSSGSMD